MKRKKTASQTSVRMARRIWNNLSRDALTRLKEIATQHDFSVGAGDLIYLNNGWYVTHTGLIALARRKRCSGIHVEAVDSLCDSGASRFVLKATVFPSKGSSGFVGYGDADPSNVSSLVRGAEMRVAETRAVNRALRKAYGIGICSVEEIGTIPTVRSEEASSAEHEWQRERFRPEGSRPPLPDYPPAQTRSRTGKGLCRRLLRHQDSREKLAGNRLRTSSSNWPTGPRRTAMLCSASSTVISAKKKVPHEAPDHRPARRRSLCRRPDPRRGFPGYGATSQVSAAGTETLLHPCSGHSRAQPICGTRSFPAASIAARKLSGS